MPCLCETRGEGRQPAFRLPCTPHSSRDRWRYHTPATPDGLSLLIDCCRNPYQACYSTMELWPAGLQSPTGKAAK
jgi:hypothetical protein